MNCLILLFFMFFNVDANEFTVAVTSNHETRKVISNCSDCSQKNHVACFLAHGNLKCLCGSFRVKCYRGDLSHSEAGSSCHYCDKVLHVQSAWGGVEEVPH